LTPTATITAAETIRVVPAHLQLDGVEPDRGPVALQRPVEELCLNDRFSLERSVAE
jgi:hypothetical protein